MGRTCIVMNPALLTGTTMFRQSIRLAEANPGRVEAMRQQMDQVPYLLDKDRRIRVLDTPPKSALEVCS